MLREYLTEARFTRWARDYDLAQNRICYLNWYLGSDVRLLSAPVKLRERHGLVCVEVGGVPLWWSRLYDCYALGEMVRNLDACDKFLFQAVGLCSSRVDNGVTLHGTF